jgi:hypothetical protein
VLITVIIIFRFQIRRSFYLVPPACTKSRDEHIT